MPKTGMVDCVSCVSSPTFFGGGTLARYIGDIAVIEIYKFITIIFCGDFRAGMYQPVFRACDLP